MCCVYARKCYTIFALAFVAHGTTFEQCQESIALVLQTGLLQAHELARLRVIAQGNGFAAAMCRLGHVHARCQQAMVRSARLLSGALLVSAAGFAALMVLAVYSVGSFVGT